MAMSGDSKASSAPQGGYGARTVGHDEVDRALAFASTPTPLPARKIFVVLLMFLAEVGVMHIKLRGEGISRCDAHQVRRGRGREER